MDFALKNLPDGYFDLDLDNDDFLTEGGLNTAVQLSLFGQRSVNNRGGYWADFLAENLTDQFGSRLWSVLVGKP